MNVMSSEFRERFDHWLRTLKEDLYTPLGEISFEMSETFEELSLADAKKLAYKPVKPGTKWGHSWEYGWMRGKFTLPEAAKGKRICMNLEPGGESVIFVDGEEFGTFRASWVDEKHHYVVDNYVTREGVPGTEYEIYLETYAGHFYPEHDGVATGPVIPGSYTDPLTDGERVTIGKSTFGVWDEDAYQLFMDVDTLVKILDSIEDTSLRASKIADALEKFTLIVDFEQDKEGRSADYRKAREAIKPAMEAVNGSSMPVFYGVGHAHIDLAWLWPMQETFRKSERTLAAQLRMIEEYPEYKYIQSQPALYEMCRKYYPALFERIREAIKGGQWIADGAMWVEPDTNMTSGESLVRQLIYGKRYYKEVLGVDSDVLWLPDTFGYTAALPQILQGCNVKYLVTQKIFWSYNDCERFPYHYFRWEGNDGTEVVSFLPTSYTYSTNPKELNEVWKERAQVRDLDTFLIPFGYGDGGGGPTRDHVEYAKRLENLEGAPKFKMASPKEFFTELENRVGLPDNKYKGELYFAAHRGTYTSQAMVKYYNRKNEFLMRELEMWGALAALNGKEFDFETVDDIWRNVLLHQFHDILPGSSIAKVYTDAEKEFVKIHNEGEQIIKSELECLTKADEKAVTVFNSLSFERSALAELPENFNGKAAYATGEAVPTFTHDGASYALVKVPSCGAVSIVPATESSSAPLVSATKTAGGIELKNDKVTVLINEKGEITSYKLNATGREFAKGNLNRFRLYKDVPRLFDAWDIDSNYKEQEIEALYDVNVEIAYEGLEACVVVTGKVSNSTLTQKIKLKSGSARVDFETCVDWKELHRLLKVDFPVDVYAVNGINEIQFGYVERPAHRSRVFDKDRYEVSNHKYSALCDNSHGAAVLNDCKYGIGMNDNSLELSLLKSAASPEMRADNRVHNFTYAFVAWEGSFADCDVVKEGYDLNVPVLCTKGSVDTFSFASIANDNIIIDTIKPAMDKSGDVILRLYESKKAATTTKLALCKDNFKAFECDMFENPKEECKVADGAADLSFRAFEVKTIRVSL